MEIKQIGVILARFQPIHNGHLALIKKAVKENEEVHLFIGSADKFNERNPIPVSIRKDLVNNALEENQLRDKVFIHLLDDLSTEKDNSHDWGFYFFANVVSAIGQSQFTLYYSDGYEVVTQWFPAFILRNNISLSLLARNSVESGVSATLVREYIERNDSQLVNVVPKGVFERKEELGRYILLSRLKRD